MDENEREERKPMASWNGDERRRGPSGDFKGDDRRRAEAANYATDLVGVKPPIGDSDADEQEGR